MPKDYQKSILVIITLLVVIGVGYASFLIGQSSVETADIQEQVISNEKTKNQSFNLTNISKLSSFYNSGGLKKFVVYSKQKAESIVEDSVDTGCDYEIWKSSAEFVDGGMR